MPSDTVHPSVGLLGEVEGGRCHATVIRWGWHGMGLANISLLAPPRPRTPRPPAVAKHGASWLYERARAEVMAEEIQASGGIITADDLISANASVEPLLTTKVGWAGSGVGDALGCLDVIVCCCYR